MVVFSSRYVTDMNTIFEQQDLSMMKGEPVEKTTAEALNTSDQLRNLANFDVGDRIYQSKSLSQNKSCSNCYNTYGKPLTFCSRCHSVEYCTEECQRIHWHRDHMKSCSQLAVQWMADNLLPFWDTIIQHAHISQTLISHCIKSRLGSNVRGEIRAGSLGFGWVNSKIHIGLGSMTHCEDNDFQLNPNGFVDGHMWYEGFDGTVYDILSREYVINECDMFKIAPHPIKTSNNQNILHGSYRSLEKMGYHYIPLVNTGEEQALIRRMCKSTVKSGTVRHWLECLQSLTQLEDPRELWDEKM
jgi:hypothetical protein